jgi:predicted RNA binding protein YcfA (HicA-like mRNA interferase family)
MKFFELEKIIIRDGWKFLEADGSHYHYTHPSKSGKATIPSIPCLSLPQEKNSQLCA